MKKYRILIPWEGVEKGYELNLEDNGFLLRNVVTKNEISSVLINPVVAAVLIHTGMIEEVGGKWEPKDEEDEEDYWFVDSTGAICSAVCHGESASIFRIATNNVFKTEEEAIAHKQEMLKNAGV